MDLTIKIKNIHKFINRQYFMFYDRPRKFCSTLSSISSFQYLYNYIIQHKKHNTYFSNINTVGYCTNIKRKITLNASVPQVLQY